VEGGRKTLCRLEAPRGVVDEEAERGPTALLFTGPGGGPGQRGGPGVKKGTRTMLSRHNFRRTYHGALAKLANPATPGYGRPPPASLGPCPTTDLSPPSSSRSD
jgi:hypothetical protein